MYESIHGLLRHHPAYFFGRVDHTRSTRSETEELEGHRPYGTGIETAWPDAECHVKLPRCGRAVAVTMMLLALWSLVMLTAAPPADAPDDAAGVTQG